MEEVNKNILPKEERESIILEALERALLILPSTAGSLLADHIAKNKINSEFYAKYPEFKDHKEAVVSVIEQVEGKNPLLDYKDILGKAVPKICERIKTVGSLDMKAVSSEPNRTYESLPVPKADNPHGSL